MPGAAGRAGEAWQPSAGRLTAMGKKKQSSRSADPGKAADFRVNPFVGLTAGAFDLPADERAQPPASTPALGSSPLDAPAPLTAEDRELLRAFGAAEANRHTGGKGEAAPPPAPLAGRVRLQLQRKGKSGKTVTRILGLNGLEMAAQMELVRRLCQALGTGAHFTEGVLELHGDLRERAAEWFRKNRYGIG